MRLILDYDPLSDEYIVKIDSKSKYNGIVGIGKSIEEATDNMINTFKIFLRCYKIRDKLYKSLENWYAELSFAARVKIKYTKRMAEHINPMIRMKVKGELIDEIHGEMI